MYHTAQETRILRALAAARQQLPELADLLAFYETLLDFIAVQKRHVSLDLTPYLASLDVDRWAAKGRPVLAFEWLALNEAEFAPWCRRLAVLLRRQVPELEVPSGRPLVELARRFYEQGTAGEDPATDVLLLNALAPWLERAAEQFLPHLPVRRWGRGFCPVCGGVPDFEVLISGRTRTLLCARCRASWPFPANVCPFCGEDDLDLLGYYASEDEVYRVDVCDRCGHYIKGVDRRRYRGELIPEVERLLTPGLDVWAAQEGYSRPEIWAQERR